MHKSFIKILSILLIVGLNWTGLSAVIETFAYINDTETSSGDTFTAATSDFSLTGGDFSPSGLNPGDSTTKNLTIQNDGSLGFQYKINYEKVSGNLCDYLDLTAGAYSGLLKDFTDQEPFTFSGTPSWDFVISLPAGASDSLQGEICDFKFVFNGWQEDLSWGEGLSDTEETQNIISANYWNPPVVLNEILPNPSGDDCSLAGIDGEWVEIYNKTSNPLDLDNWYIKNSTGTQITISASNTLGGSTTISANGWLVVFMDGCVLDNISDAVTFYNQNDVQVDSYSYALPEYNVNNTPGSTNDMVLYLPLDDDSLDQSGNSNNGTNNGATFVSGQINEGLSFDGIDDYVDCGNDASLDIRDELTIEAWIKPDTVSKAYYHSSIVDRGNSYWFLILNTGKLAFLRFNENDLQTGYGKFSIFSTTATIPTGEWTHVAITYSVLGGNAVKLYINGLLSAAGSFTNGPIDSSVSALTIGNRMGLHYFDGSIDEVKIYSRVLNASEILSHYGQVPENKSYARIPDGNSNWVDPVPTPGGPNILESEIINQEEAIEEEPIAEELLGEETPVAEEEPVGEGDLVIEEEPMIEEEPSEEIPAIEEESTEEEVITEENQEQGGIIEEINEIIDEVIDKIVDEIMPDEETGDEVVSGLEAPVIDEAQVIEEAPADETPAVEEQPAAVPDNSSSNPDGAGESVSVGGSGDGGSSDVGISDTGVSGDSVSSE